MSKPIQINAAQQIRWALGIDFPLFASKGEPRNASHTKKGPGRRRHTTAAEKLLRESKRKDVYVDVKVVCWSGRTMVSTGWYAERRGNWSLYMHQGVLKMRGFSTGPRRVVL